MSSFIKAVAAAVIVIGLASVIPGCLMFGSIASYEASRSTSVPFVAGSGVEVETINGSVTLIRGTSEQVQIEAKIRCTSEERLEQTQIVAEQVDGRLKISVKWPEDQPENNEGCSFTITLPKAEGVAVTTSNGGVKVNEMGGSARLRTSNGGISVVSQGGPVDARTSNGRISIESPGGAITAHSSNGAIEVIGAHHGVDASTSNGRIRVELAEDAPGPVQARTSNGGIELTIGSAFTGELKLSTSNGGLDVAEMDRARRISIHDDSGLLGFGDGPTSEARTSNGAIRVRQAGK